MTALHHVTLKTDRLAASLRFYEEYLGLRPGRRPPFDIPGAWLYPPGGEAAILHLIEVATASGGEDAPATGMFDHFALRVSGLPGYLAKVRAAGDWYRAMPVPDTNLVQIHHRDPSGVLVEATFVGEPLADEDVVL